MQNLQPGAFLKNDDVFDSCGDYSYSATSAFRKNGFLNTACDLSTQKVETLPGNAANKIAFDLGELDQQGLYGPIEGRRSLSYEFCIPAGQRYVEEVHAIDPGIRIYRQSPGRIQCGSREYLCIGETHGKSYRSILIQLAGLSYVKKIIRADFE